MFIVPETYMCLVGVGVCYACVDVEPIICIRVLHFQSHIFQDCTFDPSILTITGPAFSIPAFSVPAFSVSASEI